MKKEQRTLGEEFCSHGNYKRNCSACSGDFLVGVRKKEDGSMDYSLAARLLPVEQGNDAREHIVHAAHEVCTEEHIAAELVSPYVDRDAYTLEDAKEEQPYTHYSHAGNVFQILRFGIQSNHFKERFNALRADDDSTEALAQQMNGLRNKGASYQAADGISLSMYDDALYSKQDSVLFLIDPDIPVLGEKEDERDASLGYGHGIPEQTVDGRYAVGNPTAYKDEVIGINVIHPKELRAMVLQSGATIKSHLHKTLRATVQEYVRQRHRRPEAVEDVLADVRLLNEMSDAPVLTEDDLRVATDMLPKQAQGDVYKTVSGLYKQALASFVGKESFQDIDLRNALSQKFGISSHEKAA